MENLPYIIPASEGLFILFIKGYVHAKLIHKVEGGFDLKNDTHRIRLILPVTMNVPDELKLVKLTANMMYMIAIAALVLGTARF